LLVNFGLKGSIKSTPVLEHHRLLGDLPFPGHDPIRHRAVSREVLLLLFRLQERAQRPGIDFTGNQAENV
jgi:hypothetical protein